MKNPLGKGHQIAESLRKGNTHQFGPLRAGLFYMKERKRVLKSYNHMAYVDGNENVGLPEVG